MIAGVRVAGGAKSDRGLCRTHNEDAFGYAPELALFLVADGMGGHAAGEVASNIAATSVIDKVRELITDDDVTPLYDDEGRRCVGANRLVIAIAHANEEIFRSAERDVSRQGMGTTVAAVHFSEGFASLCHVGDSRIYRIRDDRIERLTTDHSISAHVLSRALGTSLSVDPTCRIEPVGAGERFVLCTDGIHGAVDDEEILAVVRRHGTDYDGACAALIALANERGGRDNSTAVVVGTS